jgi:phosphatidylserine decarboxylase
MNVKYPHPVVAREGWLFLAIAVLVAVFATWLAGWWSLPLWLGVVFILQFFRDPPRAAPGDGYTVVSAADGRVIAVGPARDPYLERDAIKISVFMNVFNVHSNRSPVDGEVKKRWYQAGRFFNAALDKASSENERNALWLRTSSGVDVRADSGADRAAHPVLCRRGRPNRSRAAFRFHSVRVSSRHLRSPRRHAQGRTGRQGLRSQYRDRYTSAPWLTSISADRC